MHVLVVAKVHDATMWKQSQGAAPANSAPLLPRGVTRKMVLRLRGSASIRHRAPRPHTFQSAVAYMVKFTDRNPIHAELATGTALGTSRCDNVSSSFGVTCEVPTPGARNHSVSRWLHLANPLGQLLHEGALLPSAWMRSTAKTAPPWPGDYPATCSASHRAHFRAAQVAADAQRDARGVAPDCRWRPLVQP